MANYVDVVARDDRVRVAKFTVPVGTRKEIEAAIAQKLRSGEVEWSDVPKGVKVMCCHNDDIWQPRARFLQTDDVSAPKLIEDQPAAARSNGGDAK
jgi:hypothetical protein